MKVTLVLPWFQESTETLWRCLRSFCPLVDRVVAIDGNYELLAGLGVLSPAEQVEVIEGCGIPAVVHRPKGLWAGEVEKLQYCLDVADGDWLIHCHADMELAECDPGRVRAHLRAAEHPRVFAPMHTVEHPSETRVSSVGFPPGSTRPHPFFYRGDVPWRMGGRHWEFLPGSRHSVCDALVVNHWVLWGGRMDLKWRYVRERDELAAREGRER